MSRRRDSGERTRGLHLPARRNLLLYSRSNARRLSSDRFLGGPGANRVVNSAASAARLAAVGMRKPPQPHATEWGRGEAMVSGTATDPDLARHRRRRKFGTEGELFWDKDLIWGRRWYG